MSPIKEWYPVSLKSQRIGLTPIETCLKDLCETKRRRKILSFPTGSASCVFSPFQDTGESTLFTSSGGIIVPFIDLNPFYFAFSNGQSLVSQAENLSVPLGVEKISYYTRESTAEILLDGQMVVISFEKSRYFDSFEQNCFGKKIVSSETLIVLSALAFLEPEQLATAKQEGLLIGKYLPQKAENVVAGYILVLPGSQFSRSNLIPPCRNIKNDTLYPIVLRIKSNKQNPEIIIENQRLLGTIKPIVACWKNVLESKV